ncbi:MAG: class I SAM-dependent rRNA methyltransferase, partial [Nitratireductor sp.]
MAKNSKFKRPSPFKGQKNTGDKAGSNKRSGNRKSSPRTEQSFSQASSNTGGNSSGNSNSGINASTGAAKDTAKFKDKPARLAPAKNRLKEVTGLILETAPDKNYALLDSGDGQKLERYENYKIIRPEAQAIWQKSLAPEQWKNADAIFTGDTDEEGMGRWAFPKKQLDETWPMAHDGVPFFGRFTSFRHTGVFPEQAAHWRFMVEALKKAKADKTRKEQPRVLNLFGYTGVASLVA